MASIKPRPENVTKPPRSKQSRPRAYTVARKEDERPDRERPGTRGHERLMSRCLAGGGGSARLRTFRITLDGKPEKKNLTRHAGEEFILVEEGALRARIGKNVEVLYEGDSIYFRSGVPHRIENVEGWHTVILAVICG